MSVTFAYCLHLRICLLRKSRKTIFSNVSSAFACVVALKCFHLLKVMGPLFTSSNWRHFKTRLLYNFIKVVTPLIKEYSIQRFFTKFFTNEYVHRLEANFPNINGVKRRARKIANASCEKVNINMRKVVYIYSPGLSLSWFVITNDPHSLCKG